MGINGNIINWTRGKLTGALLWNLAGHLFPLFVAFLSIPQIIKGLGTERFGVLSLVWGVITYFSIFDLGINRAQSKYLSETLANKAPKDVSRLIWTALFIALAIGFACSILIFLSAQFLSGNFLNIPDAFAAEGRCSFYILACSLPFVGGTTSLGAALESNQLFRQVCLIRIPLGIYSFAAPLIVLPFTSSLTAVVAILVAGRLVGFLVHLRLCAVHIPAFFPGIGFDRKIAGALLRFGGWLTISSLIGPILLYGDRFFIAAQIGPEAVAYYTTPFEVVSKLLIIPSAALSVLFPALCFLNQSAPYESSRFYHYGVIVIGLIMTSAAFLFLVGAKPFMIFWLGEPFARNSYQVMQILGVGVAINSVGLISQSRIHSLGRPDLTAKLHVIELGAFLVYLPLLISIYGIVGAATAWCFRVTISTLVLSILAKRLFSLRLSFNADEKACSFL